MIIVADSGSTKTDWKFHDKVHGIQDIETQGLNPYFLDSNQILSVLDRGLHPYLDRSKVDAVYFYGSGCSHADKILEVESALSDFFKNSEIFVESDLLGAARALCGNHPGIVAILGTGSNSCVYDGSKITEQILSLGYMLGDEGSGAILGKTMLKHALSGSMPEHLLAVFKEKFPHEPGNVLVNIYSKPFPNRYLASFAPFAIEHMEDEWVKQVLREHLIAFFEQMILVYGNYKEYSLNASGSIAWHLKSILVELCEEFGLAAGNILQRPIDRLMDYHLAAQE